LRAEYVPGGHVLPGTLYGHCAATHREEHFDVELAQLNNLVSN
jgi:hypothetical protein